MVAPEVPDWTRPVSVMGKDSEGNPVTVLLDSLGRLICVLYGAITLSGPIDVTQVDSTREIQGADGVTLHTIAVDSEGRIIAIVKGEYAGTLKNLAVDSQGRMIMIPTDPADVWGNAISMGNAELAAVLDYSKRFDRRGCVYFLDGFENGLVHVFTGGTGTGTSVTIESAETLSGGHACKLTGASDGGLNAYILYRLGKPILSKMGVEFSFRLGDNVERVHLILRYYDGTNLHTGQIRYDPANDKWEYMNSSAVWTTLQTGSDLPSLANLFHPCKLVLDFINDKYVRALITGEEVDMSTYGLIMAANTTSPMIDCYIGVLSNSGFNGWIYVDNVVITQGEPA